MSVVVMVAATCLLFAVARAWMQRWGNVLTLRDPAMWLLAGVATAEAGFESAQHLAFAVILALGTVCALTDRQTGCIFNVVLMSATALLLPCVLMSGNLESSAIGAAVCGWCMLFLHVVTRGRGLGLGDVKLAALIGGGLALPAGILALGAAFVVGSLAVVATALMHRGRVSKTIAFGPYLAIGSMLSIGLVGMP